MNKYAFFDVDGTLISIKSMMSFSDYFWKNRTTSNRAKRYLDAKIKSITFEYECMIARDRKKINEIYYRQFSGIKTDEINRMIDNWYKSIKRENKDLFISEVVDTLISHRNNDIQPVFVSGSFIELLMPIANELGVKHILATRLEKRDDIYTGKIIPPQMIGDGKAMAIMDFMENNNTTPEACYAYGDHHTDIPMLSSVGNATVVNADLDLHDYAKQRNWNIMVAA